MPTQISRPTCSLYFEVLWGLKDKKADKEADVIIVQNEVRSIKLSADPTLPKTFVNFSEPMDISEFRSESSGTKMLRLEVKLVAYFAGKILEEKFVRALHIPEGEHVLVRTSFMKKRMDYAFPQINPTEVVTHVQRAIASGSYLSLVEAIKEASENMVHAGCVELAKQELQCLQQASNDIRQAAQKAFTSYNMAILQSSMQDAIKWKLTLLMEDIRLKIHQVEAEQDAAVQAMRSAKLAKDVEALSLTIRKAREVNADSSDIANAQNVLYALMEFQSVCQDLNTAATSCDLRKLRSAVVRARKIDETIEDLEFFEARLHHIEKVERMLQAATHARDIGALDQALENARDLKIFNDVVRDASKRLDVWRAEEAKKRCHWKAYFQHDSSCDEVVRMEAADTESVKTAVFMNHCTGFCVRKGFAYIKNLSSSLEYKGRESEHMLYEAVSKDLPTSQEGSGTINRPGSTMLGRQYDMGCTIVWQFLPRFSCRRVWKDLPSTISKGLEEAYHASAESMYFVNQNAFHELSFREMKLYPADNDNCSKESVRRHFVAPRVVETMWHPVLKSNVLVEHCNRVNNLFLLTSDIRTSVQTLSSRYIEHLKSARCERRIELPLPTWRHVDVDAVIVLAAVSIACFTVYPQGPDHACFVFQCQDNKCLWEDTLQDANIRMQTIAEMPNESIVPEQSGFAWLRHNNDAQNRFLRLAGACSSLFHCMTGVDQSGKFNSRHIASLVENTELLDYGKIMFERLPCETFHTTAIGFERGQTLIQAAVQHAKNGHRVAVVNAASGYHVGGGFLSGGRHALEEAICMQSTLYFSLAQAERISRDMSLRDSNSRHIHIPEEGCVLSPIVDILRHGTDRGYILREDVVTLVAVLSVAMPNKNPSVSDSPVDRRSDWSYRQLVERKFETVVRGAIKASAGVLIMPDCGCGVFKNDPVVVGKALGKVLRKKKGYFFKVVLVGSETFAKAVNEEFNARRSSLFDY